RQIEKLEAVLERAREVVGLQIVVAHFRGQEEFIAPHARRLDRLTDLLLVAVIGGRIEVTIAGADRRQDRLRAGLLLQSPRAEADDRNARTMRRRELHESPPPLSPRRYSAARHRDSEVGSHSRNSS